MKLSSREAPRRTDFRATRLLTSLEAVVVVVLLVAMLVTASIQVTTRYVFNSPVRWTEEISTLTLVWLAFMGAALVSGVSDHVTMRIGGKRLGRRGRVALAILAHLIVIASCVGVIMMGFDAMQARMSLDLPATGLPGGLAYAGAVTGFALIAVHSAMNVLVIVMGGYDEAAEDTEDGFL